MLAEKEKNNVKPYDFKSNIFLHPDELKVTKILAENYAELLSISLTNYFKEEVNVIVKDIVVNKFSQTVKSISPPVILVNLKIDNMEGEVFLHIDKNILFLLMDKLLGGDAKNVKIIEKKEEITFIEEKLILKIAERFMKYFEKIYSRYAKIEYKIKEIEKKVENMETKSMEELIITQSIEVNIGIIKGHVDLNIPAFIMDPILQKGGKKSTNVSKDTKFDNKYEKFQRLKEVAVDLKVMLSEIKIKIRDILDIQVGDCITLNQDIHKPLKVIIGDKEKFLGMPGLRGKHLAIKITGQIKNKEE